MTKSTATAPLPTSDEVVAGLPFRWHTQGAIFIVGGLGFMFDAWDVALNGFLIPLLSEEWGLSPGQAAWIATANLLGMAIGAIVWGGIADRIGRKKAFIFTLLIFSLFTVAGAFTNDLSWFLVFRFFAGFGLGGCIPVDYALVGEFTPRKQRGKILTAMDGWWPLGATLCGLVSAWLITFADWRAIMLVMVLPALLVVAVRVVIPESPLYLAHAGRRDEADAVIARLVKRTGGTATEWTYPEVAPRGGMSLSALSGQIAAVWKFSPRVTAIAWLLFVAVLVLYYAALTWLPGILRAQGLTNQASFLATTGMTAIGILGVVLAAVLVDRIGRKGVLALSSILAAGALVVFSVFLAASGAELNLGAKLSILVFGFLIQVAIPVLYTYVSELYPTALRGSGFGWASAASRVATGLAPLLFGGFLWPVLGLTWTFALVGILVVVAMAVMMLGSRETTGEILR